MERVRSAWKRVFFYSMPLLFLSVIPGCMGGLEFGGASTGAIAANMTPDRTYQPTVGDRAVLFGTGADAPWDMVALLKDMTAFDKYERALKSPNGTDLADMEQDGWLMRTPIGTRVSVLALKDRTHIADRYAAEVRVLDGPFKDRTVWTPATLVTRLVQIETPE